MTRRFLAFPEGFLWGASASSHQVEGHTKNDWTEWEHTHAEKLAQDAATEITWMPNWNALKQEALSKENYISGRATDHYKRYREDFDLMKDLNFSTYRMSIEWSRIEPHEGVFDEEAIEHYHKVFRELRERNISVIVTLWHFTSPVWFSKKGGWYAKNAAKYFLGFVDRMFREYKEYVHLWVTFNELELYSNMTYLQGKWLVQQKSLYAYYHTIKNICRAHNEIFILAKRIDTSIKIGVSLNVLYVEPTNIQLINRFASKMLDWWINHRILRLIRNHYDFIGLNYYVHSKLDFVRTLRNLKDAVKDMIMFNTLGIEDKDAKISDTGLELYPEGLFYLLKDMKKYKKPIYITEHGLADHEDVYRSWYIKESLRNVYKAIQEGADVRGYIHWSLTDNFEWQYGFWPRFGLIKIDYNAGRERIVRQSAYEYSNIIKENGLFE